MFTNCIVRQPPVVTKYSVLSQSLGQLLPPTAMSPAQHDNPDDLGSWLAQEGQDPCLPRLDAGHPSCMQGLAEAHICGKLCPQSLNKDAENIFKTSRWDSAVNPVKFHLIAFSPLG